MNDDDIDQLKIMFPGFFENRQTNDNWEEGYILVDDKELNNPENQIFQALYPEEDNYFNEDLLENIDENELEVMLTDTIFEDTNNETLEDYQGVFGDDFPGNPAGNLGGKTSSIDLLGFYLPWHIFQNDKWGIYLIEDAIERVALKMHYSSKKLLSKNNCRKLLREFVFAHEKYHNIVETFATRLEISHRIPVYLDQVKKLYLSSPKNKLVHEEALAEAYGYLNIFHKSIFKKIENSKSRYFNKKKKIAEILIRKFLQKAPYPYNLSLQMLSRNKLEHNQKQLQEFILNPSFKYSNKRDILMWKFGTYMMSPSLRRNGKYIFIISKKSSVFKKNKLNLHYVKIQTLIKKLRPYGIKEAYQGGKHPKKLVLPNGKPISVPTHGKDIAKGMAHKILKDCEIGISLRDLLNRK